MRKAIVALLLVLTLPALMGSLPSGIENTIRGWFGSSGKLIGFRFSPNNNPPAPKTNVCDVYMNSSGDLVSACNGLPATTLISGSVLGCLQNSGVMSCIAFVSADQNTLPTPATNYFKLFDNDVDLTPSPSCADYGQSGLITVMDTDESSVDRYVLCDGTTEVDVWNAKTTSVAPFGVSTGGSPASEPADDDDCLCWRMTVDTAMAALEKVTVRVGTADADDTLELAVYSAAGTTQLFEAGITLTSIAYVTATNGLTAPPLPRGDYWLCFGYNEVTANGWTIDAAHAGAFRRNMTLAINEGCPAGEMPNTIDPSGAAWNTTSIHPSIVFSDE